VKIDELQGQIEKSSRSQAMQPTAPITDVLEHPIVKTRMLQLDDKARDLLIWIEQEPGHTREELAARMISSKDVVAGLVDKINHVFQLEVIVDDKGRPLRYKSMLKRLFLTDVARREIDELDRVTQRAKSLEDELETLRPIAQQSTALRGEVERLTRANEQQAEHLETQGLKIKDLSESNATLSQENAAFKKIKEGFAELGLVGSATPTIDDAKIIAIVKDRANEILKDLAQTSPIDQESLNKIVDAAIEKRMPEIQGGVRKATLQQTLIEIDVEQVKLDGDKFIDNTDKGKIMALAKEGKLNAWHSTTEIWNAILENKWTADRSNLSKRLNDLVQDGYLATKKAANGTATYVLAPNVKFKN